MLWEQGKLPVLRARGQRSHVRPPLLDGDLSFHLFISHVWSTGQDQARAIKQLLQQSLPGCRIFLDVDDLEDISQLEDKVDASAAIVVFISAAYFGSRNCMRELKHSVLRGKQLILVRETSQSHGAIPLEEAMAQCPKMLR